MRIGNLVRLTKQSELMKCESCESRFVKVFLLNFVLPSGWINGICYVIWILYRCSIFLYIRCSNWLWKRGKEIESEKRRCDAVNESSYECVCVCTFWKILNFSLYFSHPFDSTMLLLLLLLFVNTCNVRVHFPFNLLFSSIHSLLVVCSHLNTLIARWWRPNTKSRYFAKKTVVHDDDGKQSDLPRRLISGFHLKYKIVRTPTSHH